MTLLGHVMSLYPAALGLAALACAGWLLARPGWAPALALPALLYLVPLLSFRLHGLLFPLREGPSRLVGPSYSPWYGGHMIQALYIAFPALEVPLRLVPGLYSLWLRAWGSRIGRRVYWTPLVEVTDRSLLEVGDGVVFGHRSGVFCHLVTPTRSNMLLYVKRVRIEAGAFLGAGSYLAPGCVVEAGAVVTASAHLLDVNRRFVATPRRALGGAEPQDEAPPGEAPASQHAPPAPEPGPPSTPLDAPAPDPFAAPPAPSLEPPPAALPRFGGRP